MDGFPSAKARLRTYTLFGNKTQEGLAQYMIREVFARLADEEEREAQVWGSALEPPGDFRLAVWCLERGSTTTTSSTFCGP